MHLCAELSVAFWSDPRRVWQLVNINASMNGCIIVAIRKVYTIHLGAELSVAFWADSRRVCHLVNINTSMR